MSLIFSSHSVSLLSSKGMESSHCLWPAENSKHFSDARSFQACPVLWSRNATGRGWGGQITLSQPACDEGSGEEAVQASYGKMTAEAMKHEGSQSEVCGVPRTSGKVALSPSAPSSSSYRHRAHGRLLQLEPLLLLRCALLSVLAALLGSQFLMGPHSASFHVGRQSCQVIGLKV